jgi:hypothetical protein
MIGYYDTIGQMGNYMVVNELWKSMLMKRSHFKQLFRIHVKRENWNPLKYDWYLGKIRFDK